MSRRAQMEMIGLVFVVVILVVGIILYARYSTDTVLTNATPRVEQASSPFLTALKETDVPGCGTGAPMSVEQVARACYYDDDTACAPGGATSTCGYLQDFLKAIAAQTLDKEFLKYNLSLNGKAMSAIEDCDSANIIRTGGRIVEAPRITITLDNGAKTYLVLTVCP